MRLNAYYVELLCLVPLWPISTKKLINGFSPKIEKKSIHPNFAAASFQNEALRPNFFEALTRPTISPLQTNFFACCKLPTNMNDYDLVVDLISVVPDIACSDKCRPKLVQRLGRHLKISNWEILFPSVSTIVVFIETFLKRCPGLGVGVNLGSCDFR